MKKEKYARLDERIGYYLARIRQLYAVERRTKELTSEERQQLRQTESLPLLESFGRMSGFPIIWKRNARKPLDWAQWKDYSGILQIFAVFERLPHSENFL